MGQQFSRQSYIVRRADVSVYVIGLNIDDDVPPAGQTLTTTVYAPVGTLLRIQAVEWFILAPTGATAGTHKASIAINNYVTTAENTFNNTLLLQGLYWKTYSTRHPESDVALAVLLKNMLFDSIVPIKFIYTNNTNVTQTNQMSIRIITERQVI